MDTFQDIIQFLLWNNISKVHEIAAAMGVASATVYGYKNQGTEPKFSQILALNRWLVKKRGCYIIQDLFCIARRPHADLKDYNMQERLKTIALEINSIKSELMAN